MNSIHFSVRIPRDVLSWIKSFATANYEGNMNMAIVKLLRKAIECSAQDTPRAGVDLGESRSRREKKDAAR